MSGLIDYACTCGRRSRRPVSKTDGSGREHVVCETCHCPIVGTPEPRPSSVLLARTKRHRLRMRPKPQETR